MKQWLTFIFYTLHTLSFIFLYMAYIIIYLLYIAYMNIININESNIKPYEHQDFYVETQWLGRKPRKLH